MSVMSDSGEPGLRDEGNTRPDSSRSDDALPSTSRTCLLSGTLCSTPAFIRWGGIRHTCPGMSISSQAAPLAGTGRLTFPSGAVNVGQLPSAGQPVDLLLDFGQTTTITPAPTETAVKLWAARRDFSASDFLRSTDAGLINVENSRYLVRAESWPDVEAGDIFQDEDDHARTIQGVSETGRDRYLELLARRVG